MKLGTHMPDGERRKPIDNEVCRTKVKNLGTHMPDGERRKPIDIEVCRIKVKVTTSKNRTKIGYFFLFLHDILRTKCRI